MVNTCMWNTVRLMFCIFPFLLYSGLWPNQQYGLNKRWEHCHVR